MCHIHRPTANVSCFVHFNNIQGFKIFNVSLYQPKRCMNHKTQFELSFQICRLQISDVHRIFFWGGGSTNSVEDRENGDLGAVAPWSGFLEAAVIWYKKFRIIL